MIKQTTDPRDKAAIEDYNILAFICQTLIPVIDRLKETTQYRQQLKKACNDVLREAEIVTNKHFQAYEKFGDLQNEDRVIHSRQIYAITATAYDKMINVLSNAKAHEITSLVALWQSENLSKVDVKYKPIQE